MELGALASIGGVASGRRRSRSQSDGGGDSDDGGSGGEAEQRLTARQEEGNAFYWVLPGERRLSPQVFGTPDSPRHGSDLLAARIEQAKQLPEPLGNAIPQLLEDMPILVAAPDEARAPIENDGGSQNDGDERIATQKLAQPTPFGDDAQVTSGQFEITYHDRQPYDLPGAPGDTSDTVDLDASFTDPAGNEYELVFDHVVQPPIPGNATGGGVKIGGQLHGNTGTGSPLMAQTFNYGACWGIGNVRINGEVSEQNRNKLIHFMTTQTVRDERYDLAIDEEMPLPPERTIAGQIHHTHGFVQPITATDEGPVYEPVETAFELPNGDPQPFIHAMWEQDEIVEGPFADWEWPGDGENGGEQAGDGGGTPQADFRLVGNTQGWEGAAPEGIAGETNPTMELEAGTEYALVWENGDGLQHNFAIQDSNGEDLLSTELVSEQGATQTVTFTASEEMAEYYCQVHPSSMRGSVDMSG